MNDINQLTILGNIVRDAELKMTSGGFGILRLTIAVSKTIKKDGDYKKSTSFFDIVVFGKYAESLVTICTKGKKIAVTGELSQNVWVNKEGNKQSKVEIHANSVFVFTKDIAEKDFTKEDSQAIEENAQFIDDIPF